MHVVEEVEGNLRHPAPVIAALEPVALRHCMCMSGVGMCL